MLTGIVLWWPKRKTDRKRSFTIKWKGRWRRVNYDLHNVLGFYVCSIALLLALSGLAIAFNWARDGIYKAANLGKTYPFEKSAPQSAPPNKLRDASIHPADRAFNTAMKRSPQAQMFFIIEGDGKAGHTTSVTAYYRSMHFYKSDYYTFDQHSGRLLKFLPQHKKSPGMKMNDANYDIHVGQILGFSGKIIAFLGSLICASLPVTGFVVWLGKRKKKKRNPHIRHHLKTATI